jgi:cytochrome b561
MLKNTTNSYGVVAKTFHWLIALGIVGMLIVGFIMADMEPSPTKMTLYGLHKATGALILMLVVLRLTWRFFNAAPQLPKTLTPWHHHLAKLSPVTLYTLLFLMPLSGYTLSVAAGYPVNFFGLFTLPSLLPKNPQISKIAVEVHKYGAFAFIGILVLHMSAAFYHHFILKTNVLRRMLPSWLLKFSRSR